MRPAHANMYGQPTYVLPPTPVQYFNAPISPQQYGRNPQELQQQPMQPVYLVPQQQQPVMQQYAVMGTPIPQAMAIQGVVPAFGAPTQPGGGWAYRPAMPEPWAPYGARVYNEEPRNWQPAPSQGFQGGFQGPPANGLQGRAEGPGNGFQGRAEGPGNGFQGRAEGPGNGFQGRADGHGNSGPGSFQGRAGNARPDNRGFENNRQHSSGPRNQHSNRPPQSPAPLQSKQLSCEPCEKTFNVYAQYTAHMNTHVQCDDVGCSFSASGKVVKEHKLTAHSKPSNPSPRMLKRAEESNEENKAWREERRRNYPTRSNIQRKKEIHEGKMARGELIDDDAKQRRQRMKEILAKQAELGVPVAEVPSYYLTHKDDRAKTWKRSDDKQLPDTKKRKPTEDANEEQPSKSARTDNTECENREGEGEPGTSEQQPSGKTPCYFYQRGRCRKGNKCHFAHTRGAKEGGRQKKKEAAAAADKKRPPTLLSKLLHAEITRDKSYLLQCLRFIVNNNFLLDGILPEVVESDAAEESSDYSEGEVVEAPDMLLADTAIINTLLSEQPEVLAKVLELETQA